MTKGDRAILKADPGDGTTPIANLLLEALVVANLTSKERAAILFLIRRTYGWQVNGNRLKADVIPLSTWVKVLQVKDTTRASRILSGLEKKQVIKRREPPFPLIASKGNLISAGQKLSLGYYLTYYLLPYGVGKFVGKMLAKILLLIESVNRRKTGIQ